MLVQVVQEACVYGIFTQNAHISLHQQVKNDIISFLFHILLFLFFVNLILIF